MSGKQIKCSTHNTRYYFKSKIRSINYYIITNKIKNWTQLFYLSKSELSQIDLFKERSNYIFVLSEIGNGLDCYRTWESLLFGNIVIIKTSPLDDLFIEHNYPVVIIDDYTQINKQNLLIWYNKYKDLTSLNNNETEYRLTNEYWINYIKQKSVQKLSSLNEKGF